MAFKVRLDLQARRDLIEIHAFIVEASGATRGRDWLRGALAEIRSLGEMPGRLPLVPEPLLAERGVRHLIYHSHRVIYEVANEEVLILRIYHVRRDRLRTEDLSD